MPNIEINNGLDQAKKLLLQLRNDFLAELPEKLDTYEPIVLSLAQPDNCQEGFESLYRSIHSLKGSAGTHGIPTITYICHQFEDALNDLGFNNCASPEMISIFLEHLDLIRRTGEIAIEESANFADIDKALDNIRQRMRQGKVVGLIVEDTAYMRNIFTTSLNDKRLEYTFIKDGLEALGLLLRIRYDFLITGSETRSLNGTALHYALRAAGGVNRKIKTIMVTSKGKPEFASNLAPDYVVHKDKHITEQLQSTMNEIINQ